MSNTSNCVVDMSHFNSGIDFSTLKSSGVVGVIHKATQGVGYTDSNDASCRLWIAQYASAPKVPATWSAWTLWQYTDGQEGPNARQTQGHKLDRDLFNGSAAQCQEFWAQNS